MTYCPHCGEDLEEQLQQDCTAGELRDGAEIECPKCGQPIAVAVEAVPFFHVTKR